MQNLSRLAIVLGMAATFVAAPVVYAESAPVYDADSGSQQYDNNGDPQQDAAPPAPEQMDQPAVPGDEAAPNEQVSNSDQSSDQSDNTFVPAQQIVPPSHPQARTQVQVVAPSTEGMSIDQRLKRIEQQVNNMQTSDSTQRVESLQDQVQTLRGQVEQLMHQLEQLQTQQKTMFNDLDKRLSQQGMVSKAATVDLDSPVPAYKRKSGSKPGDLAAVPSATKTVPAAAVPVKSNENQPNVAEEQQIYQTAYDQIKSKKYNDAINTLQNMLKKYPSGQFAS